MIPKEQLTTIILAGGKSQRMGKNKAFLNFKGQTFIKHILSAAKGLTQEIVIIGNTKKYESLGLRVYPDLIKDCGPVGGIYTAMQVVKTPYLLVLSCDIPLLRGELLKYLIEQSLPCDVNVLRIEEHLQPLTAIYNNKIMPVFKKALDARTLKLRSLLAELHLNTIGCPKALVSCLDNINTPNELKKLEMDIKIKYFGLLAEVMGKTETTINIKKSCTV